MSVESETNIQREKYYNKSVACETFELRELDKIPEDILRPEDARLIKGMLMNNKRILSLDTNQPVNQGRNMNDYTKIRVNDDELETIVKYRLKKAAELSENVIVDFNDLDVSSVRRMNNLFSVQVPLVTIDISTWNTSNVYSMEGMFAGCEFAGVIGISTLNTSNVESMYDMFSKSNIHTPINISQWDVFKVKKMGGMFNRTYIKDFGDLSKWDVSNVRDMSFMFADSKINDIGVIGRWNVSSVRDMRAMFSGFKSATNYLDLSDWNVSNVKNMFSMFADSTLINLGDLGKWNLNTEVNLLIMFKDSKISNVGNISTWKISPDNFEYIFEGSLLKEQFTINNGMLINISKDQKSEFEDKDLSRIPQSILKSGDVDLIKEALKNLK